MMGLCSLVVERMVLGFRKLAAERLVVGLCNEKGEGMAPGYVL